jgi:ABC-type lipoprotein export system ATPase subunit
VVITGESGVGKSRLLTETAQQAATGGMAVLSGQAVQPIPRSMW